MLVSGLRNESLANLVSGSDAKFADVHKSLRECAQAIRDKYQQKQAKNKVKRRIKTHAIKVLLEELSNVPEDSAATRETISSALERHVEALRNHEHLLSKKGNTYALLKQTRGLRMGHGDAPAELAPLLQYHDLKDKLLASDSPVSANQKRYMFILDAKKGLTMTALESMDELSRDEETGRLSYVYNGRSFPLQDLSSKELPENFICCICKNIINQPRKVCSLSHLTCLECVRKLEKRENPGCPQCKENLLAEFKENTAIEQSIGNLQVRCCNDGCRSIMPISEIKSHLDLCEEEKIECPGKCTDESTDEMLRIPRKRLADHSKECPKHFRCDNCAERFPYSTETKCLEQYRAHMAKKHGTAENTSSGFVTNLVDEFLSQREQLQKQVATQADCEEFQAPLIAWDRDSPYRFAGTDCVRTPQQGVYQSRADPRQFFVTMEVISNSQFHHHVKLPFQIKDTETIFNSTLDVYFHKDLFFWQINIPKALNYEGTISITSYTGNSYEGHETKSTQNTKEIRFKHTRPYEGNCYLFKIVL